MISSGATFKQDMPGWPNRLVRRLPKPIVAMVAAAPVAAQDFPGGKPIEMTVMFGAGSAADVTARHLADGMSKALKTPVPVVNRTGLTGEFDADLREVAGLARAVRRAERSTECNARAAARTPAGPRPG